MQLFLLLKCKTRLVCQEERTFIIFFNTYFYQDTKLYLLEHLFFPVNIQLFLLRTPHFSGRTPQNFDSRNIIISPYRKPQFTRTNNFPKKTIEFLLRGEMSIYPHCHEKRKIDVCLHAPSIQNVKHAMFWKLVRKVKLYLCTLHAIKLYIIKTTKKTKVLRSDEYKQKCL